MALAVPAIAEVTDEDVDRARQTVNEIMKESEALGRQVQDAWARQYSLEKEISDLESSIDFARVAIAEAEKRLEEAAVELYMGSASAASIQVLFSASDEEYGAGMAYLEQVSGEEEDIVNQLRSLRTELDRQTEQLAAASEEQEVLTSELEAMASDLQTDLISAQAVYDQLVETQAIEEEARRRAEEEARRRAEEEARRAAEAATSTTGGAGNTSAPPATTAPDPEPEATTTTEPADPPDHPGKGVCPVAGAVSFSDTWGAPRSGGRRHEGVDMIAARGTPIVAIYDGTIARITTGSLSGLAVWLRADNGDSFFYAHLDDYGEISTGVWVPAGYTIGHNGSTGNAPSWLPHLHFEWHPGGGAAVNPYPLVKSLCG